MALGQNSPKGGEGFKSPSVTLCEWCGKAIPPTRRRGSAQRFCSPKHRVAAHRAAKQGVLVSPKPRHRKTRRKEFPHGCWRQQGECLVLHGDCSCKRCRYNTCECVQMRPGDQPSVPVSGLLVPIRW